MFVSKKRLASRYRKLRHSVDTENKKCSQDMLAEKLKITKTQISNLENGKRPSITELKKYANYFNVGCDYLLGIEPKDSIPNELDYLLNKNAKQFLIEDISKKQLCTLNFLLGTTSGQKLLDSLTNFKEKEVLND